MSNQQTDVPRQFLRSVDIFKDLTEAEVDALVEKLRLRKLTEGETLFREGDEGDELFVVAEGRIITSVETEDGTKIDVARFEPGTFFGEMSIFEDAPRSATCYAGEPSLIYGLKDDDFDGLIASDPGSAIKIMRRMLSITTSRLMSSSTFLSGMVQWGEGARKRAITDEFTGLYNRRFLDNALDDQLAKARIAGRPLSLIMIDLDRFNTINNEYGQPVGDEVIKAVVPVFQRHFRETDIVARYGGDEFTVLLPDTEAEDAARIGEQVRADVEALDVLSNRGGRITHPSTSQGVSSYPRFASDVQSLKETADNALYQSKERGRNRVCIAEDAQ
jgi:diguanylate cyclase (GGDEF)-like protein